MKLVAALGFGTCQVNAESAVVPEGGRGQSGEQTIGRNKSHTTGVLNIIRVLACN